MKVIEQGAPRLGLGRRNPSTVRIKPRFVNELFPYFAINNANPEVTVGAPGLLFGTAEQDLVSVEAFRVCPIAVPEKGSPKGDCLSAAFESLLATAKMDPDLTSLELIGWYRVAGSCDTVSLLDGDIEFHNRRFRRATDVVLILYPKMPTDILLQVYSRSSNAAISSQDHRFGSLLIDSAVAVNAPIDLAIRGTINDDDDLRVFQVLDFSGRAKRRESWKRIALWFKTITPSRTKPEWMKTRVALDFQIPAPETSARPSKTTARMIPLPDRWTSEQVNSPLPPTRSAHKTLRWVSSAVLLVFAVGLALAWFYSRPLLSALPRNALFPRVPPSTPLNMRVEPHADGSLLLRWDAHSKAMQSAKSGTVQIDDGSEHRSLPLDSDQLANGSILYTPTSKDLTLRLEVFDANGLPVSESIRVVNGSASALAAHTIPDGRPSTLRQTTPVSGRNAPSPPVTARVTPATTLSSAPAPTPGHSGKTESRVMRPTTRKVPEPEHKLQGMRNPKGIDSAELSAEGRLSKREDSSSGKQESRKPVQEFPSTQLPVSSSQHAVSKNSTSTGYVPARPLKQVMPSAKSLEFSAPPGAIAVEVRVMIDEEGRVTEERVVNNTTKNELLTSAALAAAKEWIFEPAKMHGKNVPGDHTIDFRFHAPVAKQ